MLCWGSICCSFKGNNNPQYSCTVHVEKYTTTETETETDPGDWRGLELDDLTHFKKVSLHPVTKITTPFGLACSKCAHTMSMPCRLNFEYLYTSQTYLVSDYKQQQQQQEQEQQLHAPDCVVPPVFMFDGHMFYVTCSSNNFTTW